MLKFYFIENSPVHTPEFVPLIFDVVSRGMVLDSKIVCGNMGYCPPPPPCPLWNATFPKPKPPYVPPVPPSPGAPTYTILHISDLHFDSEYLSGTNVNCGEPLCCRKVITFTKLFYDNFRIFTFIPPFFDSVITFNSHFLKAKRSRKCGQMGGVLV